MAVTTSWYRKCKLTIPIASVPGDQTDFPVMLIWNGTTGNIPAEVYNSGTSSPKGDGSDIRFTSDAEGLTELAFEIVTFVPNATVGSARIKIWIKLPSVSSATPTTFYMWWNNTAATAYAATDTYGRNAVWSNSFLGVWHLNEQSGTTATNSVGSNNGTYTGTTFPNRQDTTYGYMQGFVNANGNFVSIGTGSPWQITGNISISAIVTVTSYTAAWQAIVAKGDFTYRLGRNNTSNGITFDRSVSGGFRAAVNTTVITSGYHHIAGTYDSASGSRGFVDGASGTLDANTAATLSDTKNLCIGRNTDNTGRDWNGYIGEVKIANTVRSTTWMTTEYNTTFNFVTFITTGVPSQISETVFPNGWKRKCLLTVDYTKVALSFNGFPIPLIWNGTSGNLPAELYNLSTDYQSPDGADIRFSYDAAGQYQIPFEIVTFSPNTTAANARVEIWVKLNISSTVNLPFYIWYNNPEYASALSVTDTYGRNNVWNTAELWAVYHMDGSGNVTDSTGNGRDLTNSGTTASSTSLGTARDFNGTNRDYLYYAGGFGASAAANYTAIVNVDSVDTFGGMIASEGDYIGMMADSGGRPLGFYYQGSSTWLNNGTAVDIRGAGDRHVSYVADPSNSIQRTLINAASEADTTSATAINYTGLGTQLTVGRHANGGTTWDFDGRIDEVWISHRTHSVAWLTNESNSKIGFATFITASTPENVYGIRYDAVATGASATSFSFNHTIGAQTNRTVIVGVEIEQATTPITATVTYNGVAMTLIGTNNYVTSAVYIQVLMYQILEANLPVAGTYPIAVTYSSPPTSGGTAGAVSLWNVRQEITANIMSATSLTDSISGNIIPSYDMSWVVTAAGDNIAGTYTANAPQVERYDLQGVSMTGTGSTDADLFQDSVSVGHVFTSGTTRQALLAASVGPYIPELVMDTVKSFDRGLNKGMSSGFDY
jgi:hypothetical protein